MINYMAIGNRIRKIRRDLKITQETLAEKINVTPTHVSRIECGTSSPSLQTLVDICNVLGITIDDLMQDSLPAAKKKLEGRLAEAVADCSVEELNMLVDIVQTILRNARNLYKTE